MDRSDKAALSPRRVLLVDDHPIFRHGLEALLRDNEEILVCAHADSAATALDLLRNVEFDIAILDLSLGGTDGIQLVRQFRAEKPDLPMLVLSLHNESMFALRALKAGALGYVIKTDPPKYLVQAVRQIVKGSVCLSPRLQARPIFKILYGVDSPPRSLMDELSAREFEVFTLLGKGQATSSIAQSLGLSIKTVETHRAHIKEKLGILCAEEMVTLATEWVTYHEFT